MHKHFSNRIGPYTACLAVAMVFGLMGLGTEAGHADRHKPEGGASIELGGQEVISSTDGHESTKTTKPEPSKEPISAVKGASDSGGQGKRSSKKKPPRLNYKVEYTASCPEIFSGRSSCYTFSEPPCPGGAPLIQRTVTTMSGSVVARDSYCSNDPEPSLPAGNAEQTSAMQAAVQQQREVVVTPERFQKFPILGSRLVSQPKGFSLRNGNAHMYAVPKPQSFDVEIFDHAVSVRAIPQLYLWSYGDGQTKRSQNPGKPMPNHTFDQPTLTSHVYEETGDYQIRLSTTYRGEFSVEGGPWTPIPGTANVPSEPMPMSVWRTKKLLVDQNCSEDPDGPACDSPFLKDQEPSK